MLSDWKQIRHGEWTRGKFRIEKKQGGYVLKVRTGSGQWRHVDACATPEGMEALVAAYEKKGVKPDAGSKAPDPAATGTAGAG